MKDKAVAMAVGKEMLAQLGGGWRLRVEENLGWWASAYRGPFSVSAHESREGITYSCLMSTDEKPGTGNPYWRENARHDETIFYNAADAVRAAVADARDFVNKVTAATEKGEAIVADFTSVCKCCKRPF
jgi:hypothetical protein